MSSHRPLNLCVSDWLAGRDGGAFTPLQKPHHCSQVQPSVNLRPKVSTLERYPQLEFLGGDSITPKRFGTDNCHENRKRYSGNSSM